MAGDRSFGVVSKVDPQEVENGGNQGNDQKHDGIVQHLKLLYF